MPKVRLTDAFVSNLQYRKNAAAPSGDLAVGDLLTPGLYLRVRKSGTKSWSVTYKVPSEGGISSRGKPLTGTGKRVTLGQWPAVQLREARTKALQVLKSAAQGIDPRNAHCDDNLFAAAAARFIEQELKPNIKNWQSVESTLRLHVLPVWGNRPVQSIRRADIHSLIDTMVEEERHGMAREVRKNLSRFFIWCIDRELVDSNPIDGLKRRDLAANYDAGRALTDAELKALWRACDELPTFGPLFRLLMLTGQRRGDWAAAQWDEVDLKRKELEIPAERYKSRRDHVVPLSDAALAVLGALPKGNGGYLFTTNGATHVSGFSKAKAALDEAAGVKAYYRVHDFRVTCETRLARLGFPLEVRDAVLGHTTQGLQRRYQKHAWAEEKRAALDAYAEHLLSLN